MADQAIGASGGEAAAMAGSAPPWLRPMLATLSPAGRRARLVILIFHRVHPKPDPLFPGEMDAGRFRETMGWVLQWFNVVALGEAVDRLASGTLPRAACAITFDDGYRDNATIAQPILSTLGLPATFFVATGYLDGGRMWNDTVIESVRRTSEASLDLSPAGLGIHRLGSDAERTGAIESIIAAIKHLPARERAAGVDAVAEAARARLPDDLMMTSNQVRELGAGGIEVGAHTVTHPILANLDPESARREIAISRDALRDITGREVRLFAYPNGKPDTDYRKAHVAIVRELGFSAAVSTAWGAARHGDSPFELPRFTPWDRKPVRFGLRLARNYFVRPQGASA